MNQSLWFEEGDWTSSHFYGHGIELTLTRDTPLIQQYTVHPYIYLVLEGRVRVYLISPNGAERHLYIVGSGHLLGESALWTDEACEFSASTSSNVHLLQISKHSFCEVIRQSPELSFRTLRSVSQKHSALLLQTKLLSFSDVEERVMTILQQLAACYGVKTEKGLTITIPFTHQELAYVVGSSRVSVSYVMNGLQEKGVIEKHNGLYSLLINHRAPFCLSTT